MLFVHRSYPFSGESAACKCFIYRSSTLGLGSNYTRRVIKHQKSLIYMVSILFTWVYTEAQWKPLQDLTGSRAAVRHWSVLEASGAEATRPAFSAGFSSDSKQQNRRPLQTAIEEGETLSSHRGDQQALAAHRHATALSTAAAARHPAGPQNDTVLLTRSCVSFLISTDVVGGSLSFDSPPVLILISVRFLAVWQLSRSLWKNFFDWAKLFFLDLENTTCSLNNNNVLTVAAAEKWFAFEATWEEFQSTTCRLASEHLMLDLGAPSRCLVAALHLALLVCCLLGKV